MQELQLLRDSSTDSRKAGIRSRLGEVRNRTLWLLDQVPDDLLRIRVHDFYSPIGWHFGHVGRTEEYWICKAIGAAPCDERLSFLYADLLENPKDNRVNIPDRAVTIEYLQRTREFVLSALKKSDLAPDDPYLGDGYAWEFAIQHECQHQETIAEMLQLLQKRRQHGHFNSLPWKSQHQTDFVEISGGTFLMGSGDRHGYDNEKEPHPVDVASFRFAKTPVTAYQWSEFMADGGYQR